MDIKKKKKKPQFEEPDKWPAQRNVVPYGMGERGWQAYEPYKKGGLGAEDQLSLYWDTAKPSFFEKGNRWSGVASELKQVYPEIKPEELDDIKDKIRYYLEQHNVQIESDEDYGFFDGPVDLGRRPKGDFPSNKWLPKGQEDIDVDEDVTTASKEAQLDLSNEPRIEQLVIDYLEKIPEDTWYEFFNEREFERLQEQYWEHNTKLHEDDVVKHFENMTSSDWQDIYENEMAEIIKEELNMAESAEELDSRNPGLGQMYQNYTQSAKMSALDHPLSQEEQDEVAAKYGPEYNSAALHYYQARKNGHPLGRALDYAMAEMEKQDITISKIKLLEVNETYLKGKVKESKEAK